MPYVALDTDVVPSAIAHRTPPTSFTGQLIGLSPCVAFVPIGELEQ